MQTDNNPYDILDPEIIKLTNTCGIRYLRNIIFRIILDHPEMYDSVNDMLIEAHSNQDNDKENALLSDAKFPCYPDHYRLTDFDPVCLSENDAATYQKLTHLEFLSSESKANVFIHGLIGQGREKVAIGLGDACCRQQQKTFYITYSDLIGILRTHCTDSKNNEKYSDLVGMNVLVIDNFAEDNVYDEEILDNLKSFLDSRALMHHNNFVAHKYGKELFKPCCTIITSAFEPAEWTQYMKQDNRKTLSISRLFHEKYAFSIHVDEMDMPADKANTSSDETKTPSDEKQPDES